VGVALQHVVSLRCVVFVACSDVQVHENFSSDTYTAALKFALLVTLAVWPTSIHKSYVVSR